jgi:MYXO-CTERM domain-containing protein
MSNLVNVYVGEDPPPMGDGSGGGDGADDGDGDGDGGTAGGDGGGLDGGLDGGGRGGGEDEGCGCTTAPRSAPLWGLALLGLVALRRRRT